MFLSTCVQNSNLIRHCREIKLKMWQSAPPSPNSYVYRACYCTANFARFKWTFLWLKRWSHVIVFPLISLNCSLNIFIYVSWSSGLWSSVRHKKTMASIFIHVKTWNLPTSSRCDVGHCILCPIVNDFSSPTQFSFRLFCFISST